MQISDPDNPAPRGTTVNIPANLVMRLDSAGLELAGDNPELLQVRRSGAISRAAVIRILLDRQLKEMNL